MHENDEFEDMVNEKGGSRFSAFVWGALIGAGIALLTARRTGEETRQMLNERRYEMMNQAQQVKAKAVEQAAQYKEKAVDLAQTAREKAVEKVDQVKTRATELSSEAQDKGRTLVEQAKDTARGVVANAAERTGAAAEKVERAAGGDPTAKDDEGLVLTNSEKDYKL